MTVAQRSLAARAIKAKGQAITIAWNAPGTYAPASGSVGGASASSVSAHGALFPLSAARKIDGTNIVATDETLLLSALDADVAAFVPPVNAIVTYADGSKATIIAVERLAPAGLSIMFDCVVRGHQ